MPLRVAHHVTCTRAEGPGRRFALWVQGCSLRCPGCCNPELFSPRGGAQVSVVALARLLSRARDRHGIEGLTVVGGEPLDQLTPLAALARAAQSMGAGVLIYTGYTMDEARALPGFEALWAATDTLVAGRFDASAPERRRAFIGSTNQRLVHRSRRYAAGALWHGAGPTEIQISPRGRLQIVGMPRPVARAARAVATARRRLA